MEKGNMINLVYSLENWQMGWTKVFLCYTINEKTGLLIGRLLVKIRI